MLSGIISAAKMAKRGRKPKERKGYFYEDEEDAIVKYINETDMQEKNRIFNTVLYPALTKMIESIMRRYKLFVPDEEFEQNFSDTISYLLTKINHFRPVITSYDLIEDDIDGIDFVDMPYHTYKEKARDATEDDPKYIKVEIYDCNNDVSNVLYFKKCTHKYKAYSYCGTVCRNYLMYKCAQYSKKRMRNTPYDEVFEEINNSEEYSEGVENYSDIAERLVKNVSNEIEKMINEREKNSLTDEEVIVGEALITLLRDWERVLPSSGSNKLQKSSVLYFLREETMMTTKEVRDNMKPYKEVFLLLKKMELENK